jgi:hypothetical protein
VTKQACTEPLKDRLACNDSDMNWFVVALFAFCFFNVSPAVMDLSDFEKAGASLLKRISALGNICNLPYFAAFRQPAGHRDILFVSSLDIESTHVDGLREELLSDLPAEKRLWSAVIRLNEKDSAGEKNAKQRSEAFRNRYPKIETDGAKLAGLHPEEVIMFVFITTASGVQSYGSFSNKPLNFTESETWKAIKEELAAGCVRRPEGSHRSFSFAF